MFRRSADAEPPSHTVLAWAETNRNAPQGFPERGLILDFPLQTQRSLTDRLGFLVYHETGQFVKLSRKKPTKLFAHP